jgi:hypothetical protein
MPHLQVIVLEQGMQLPHGTCLTARTSQSGPMRRSLPAAAGSGWAFSRPRSRPRRSLPRMRQLIPQREMRMKVNSHRMLFLGQREEAAEASERSRWQPCGQRSAQCSGSSSDVAMVAVPAGTATAQGHSSPQTARRSPGRLSTRHAVT